MSNHPPHSIRAVGIGLCAAGAALSMAACSSSKQSSTADASFVAKANAICAAAVAKHDGHGVPVANFDPLHPNAQDLPAIGHYFAQYGAASDTAARLDALSSPAEHQADWIELRGLIDRVAVNATAQITAANHSDVGAFEQTVTTARSLANRIDQLGPKVGFTSASPCRKVFG